MPISFLNRFDKRYKYSIFSLLLAALLAGCQSTPYHYFYAKHIEEKRKAPFLHELVNSLHLNQESQLLYRLYGNWGFSLTPLDLDQERNGVCTSVKIRHGKERKRTDLAYYNFFSDVFDQTVVIMSREENDCGYESYLEEFQYNYKLNDAVNLALLRFQEIAERLEALHFHKIDLESKYDNIEHLTAAIDQDIASISAAGYRLAESTKQFFAQAKVQLAMQAITNARQEGLTDLADFSKNIEVVRETQFNTIEEATMATIQALEELKQEVAR